MRKLICLFAFIASLAVAVPPYCNINTGASVYSLPVNLGAAKNLDPVRDWFRYQEVGYRKVEQIEPVVPEGQRLLATTFQQAAEPDWATPIYAYEVIPDVYLQPDIQVVAVRVEGTNLTEVGKNKVLADADTGELFSVPSERSPRLPASEENAAGVGYLSNDAARKASNDLIRAEIRGIRSSLTNLVAQFQDVQTAQNDLVSAFTNMSESVNVQTAAINARPAPNAYIANNTVGTIRNLQSTNDTTFAAVKDAGIKIKQFGQDVRTYSQQSNQSQKAALELLRDLTQQLKNLMDNEIVRKTNEE